MVKGVRRCSSRRAHRIRRFNPHRRQNIYMDYVSTVVKKTRVVLQTEKYHNSSKKISITHRTPIRSVLQRLASLYTLFEHAFWGCLDGVMVKGVRRCSARRVRHIRGFNPHRRKSKWFCSLPSIFSLGTLQT